MSLNVYAVRMQSDVRPVCYLASKLRARVVCLRTRRDGCVVPAAMDRGTTSHAVGLVTRSPTAACVRESTQ